MIKLSDSIKKYIEKNQPDFMLFGSIQNEWEKIVGEKISKAAKVFKIENNKIYIKCKNSVWKQELQFQKKEILIKIQEYKKTIKDIIII